jgi:GNAT superfamily N-acetyltransferase
LQDGDDGSIRELCARLSLRTRYRRFLIPIAVLPDALLRMLSDLDDPRRLALVAQLGAADGGDIVALGNVAPSDGDRAEVGLVVADAWQRQGVGQALATSLLRAAERRGYRRFLVHGLQDNPALHPLLAHVAEVMSMTTRSGVSEIAFVRRRPAEASASDLMAEGEAVGYHSH